MPSLKPNRLRGSGLRGRRGRRTPEAELGPAQRGAAERDAGEVADRVHGDLGVVGAGLHAEVAVAALRLQGVGGEVREPAQRRGLPVGEAEAVPALGVAEQRRAEPERQRQPAGREAGGLAGVPGRGVVGQRDPAAHRPALGHRRGGRGPGLEQQQQLGAGGGGDVEGGEVQPVLGGRDDAGLVRAVEGVAVDAAGVGAVGRARRADAAGEPGRAHGGPRPGVAEEAPAADRGRAGGGGLGHRVRASRRRSPGTAARTAR